MTYNVFSGTLNPTQSIKQTVFNSVTDYQAGRNPIRSRRQHERWHQAPRSLVPTLQGTSQRL